MNKKTLTDRENNAMLIKIEEDIIKDWRESKRIISNGQNEKKEQLMRRIVSNILISGFFAQKSADIIMSYKILGFTVTLFAKQIKM